MDGLSWDDDDFDDDGEDFLDRLISDEADRDPHFITGIADIAERQRILRSLIGIRKESGLTQSAVARQMGTTQSAVSEIESGAADVYLSTLQRYARSVGAPLTLVIQCRRNATTPPRAPVVYLNEWSHADPTLAGRHLFEKDARVG